MRFRRRASHERPLLVRRACVIGLTAAAALLPAVACQRATTEARPVIHFVADARPDGSYAEVSGIDAATRDAARRLDAGADAWTPILSVRVIDASGRVSETAIAGRYTISGDTLRFTPFFAFDPAGRFEVRYTGVEVVGAPRLVQQYQGKRPADAIAAATLVTDVFPSGDVVPENQLRMYIHFSAAMAPHGGLEHVTLLDEHGRKVVDPFLPLDTELWDGDRRRYTLFFDPGRQKHGIKPNRDMGPSLVAGRRYTLVIAREWRDAAGRPLGETFTRTFRVGPPALRPLDASTWRVTPPAPGSRDPLSVQFPAPLDRALLQRAIGVRRDGEPVAGSVGVDAHETRWTLTPVEPWTPGRYALIVLSILEDPAGNRPGRAFEADAVARRAAEPEQTIIPFSLAGGVDGSSTSGASSRPTTQGAR
jgi:hypothetical protein